MTRKELLECLIDRPCPACKHHKEKGCSQWNCVFDEIPTEDKAIEDIKQEINKASLGKWYVGDIKGNSEEVVALSDVLDIINKHTNGENK